MRPDVHSYLESWSLELRSQANRVRNLIGEAHWLSDGHHKEELLRSFLIRYLPKDLEITRGFVKPTVTGTICSPEVDVLISHPKSAMPYFFEGGMQIVHPNAVLAHLEVKSQFTSTNLEDALVNISRTKRIVSLNSSAKAAWSGIVFYFCAQSRTPESVLKTLEASIKKADVAFRARLQDEGVAYKQFELPSCIAIEDTYVLFLKSVQNVQNAQKQDIDVRLFSREGLCLACALADMFGSIGTSRLRGGIDVFGGFIDAIEFPVVLRKTIEL